ncbi:MAG: ABC transporter ATP-binding protein [Lachnospiraceae bacterium]|nr:ABC transporter ATP-binding protein [Candidatus Merdinaster equi]
MAINSTKDDEDLKESINSATLKRMFKFLISYKKETAIVVSLLFVSVVIGMIYPLLVQRIIDVEVVQENMTGLIVMVGVVVALAAINMALNIIWRRIMATVSNDVVLSIRRKLYIHIEKLGLDFFDGRPAGKILARVTGDVNALKDVLTSTIVQLIPEALTILIVIVLMLIVSPMLTLTAIATIPIIMLGVFLCEIVAHKRWQIMRKKDSNMTAFVHENVAGMGIVQSFSAQEEAKAEFDAIVDDHIYTFKKAVQVSDLFSPTVEISYGVGMFLMYLVSVNVLHFGVESLGTIAAFTMYIGMLFGPIRNLANYYNKLVTNLSCAERIFEIMDMEPLVRDKDNAQQMPQINGAVSFEHVDFAYPDEPDKLILKDVSFEVKPGETIALVGPTGAGKTTIVNLISRFYNTAGGSIRIDGLDISDVTVQSLRTQMGIMTQDNYLFSGSVMDNIRYGRLDATDEEIIAAAKSVHAHEFIMKLEKGYETMLGERGGNLSIGQRQLIAFARTLVRDPSILILDEATANIDTATEILVQQGIEKLLSKKTSFVVAHRLSTIRNADRILVIDEGGILESGTHGELMQKRGAYYNLYASQAM